MATFFHSKTGRGLLLAAGLLTIIALGPMMVFLLIAVIVLACLVELTGMVYCLEAQARPKQTLAAIVAIVLQGLIVFVGAVMAVDVIDRHSLWAALIMVAAVYCENAGAQIFGKKFGRTPLAPRHSPNKTLEGAAYGWVCGIFGGIVFLALAVWSGGVDLDNVLTWLAIVVIVPPVAEIGDWIESRMKRLVGVKDSSDLTRDNTRFIRIVSLSWLFGRQGGALDKTDSLWLAVGVTWLMLAAPWLVYGMLIGVVGFVVAYTMARSRS